MKIRTVLVIFSTLALLVLMAVTRPGTQCDPSVKGDKTLSASTVKELSPWYCIGPFKDEEFGNIDRTLAYRFQPEIDFFQALDQEEFPVSIKQTYRMDSFPGYLDLVRKWTVMDQWSDGYYNLLPRGPAPSRNEAVYLYRTINSSAKGTVHVHLRMQDFYKVWLNGKLVTTSDQLTKFSRYPKPEKIGLDLKQGMNHLLVKNVSRWAEHGFSFGIEGRDIVDDRFYYDVNRLRLGSVEDALEYIRSFKFSASPIPMYSPDKYILDEEVDRYEASPGAAQYVRALNDLEIPSRKILDGYDRGMIGPEAIIEHAQSLYDFLGEEIRKMPPILFLRKPLHDQNAIGPYDTDGSSPSEICMLDPSLTDPEPEVVFSMPDMRIHSMSLSFDAKTIFFSAKMGNEDQNWQIYRIGIDGSRLAQLTSGPGKNITPSELPDGRLAYISTQKGTFVECQARAAGLLYTMAPDGSDIRLLSANIDSDHTPRVINDGRILFTRWDYGIEKNVFARHGLWTVNPDGTNLRLFFGNTVEDPGGIWDARPVPGRPEILAVLGPHHNHQAGMIGLIWNGNGPEEPRGKGYRWVTREYPVYGDMTYPDGYQGPYPLNEKQFIVSYGGAKHRPEYKPVKGVKRPYNTFTPLKILYLDAFGNERIIYEAGGDLSCYSPQFLVARKKPPVIPEQIPAFAYEQMDPEEMNRSDYGADLTATMMIRDVYQGISRYVKPGEAKYIAVMEQVQKSRIMAGGEAWGHTPIIGRGTVHARRLIGLVPIEEDGSAMFTVPALRSISLNVLDKDGKTLMRMGSDMHVMPGENLSCIGCHEVREIGYGRTPPMARPAKAFRKAPRIPEKPGWGTQGLIDYVSVVQPVWDKHCVKCHSGPIPEGNVNMTGDKTRFFNQSYGQLVDRDIVDHLSVFSLDHDEGTPKTTGAWVSSIDRYMDSEHCGSEISWDERFAVYCWIDANVPYYGTYEYNMMDLKVRGLGARDAWESKSKTTTWASGDLQDMFDRRCASCHEREVLNQSWLLPVRMKVYSDVWGDKALSSHGFGWKWELVNKLGPEYRINLTNPSHSLLLQAPLSAYAGGAGMCKNEDGSPVFPDMDDPDYVKALEAIETGKERLYRYPRIDMVGKEGFMNVQEKY